MDKIKNILIIIVFSIIIISSTFTNTVFAKTYLNDDTLSSEDVTSTDIIDNNETEETQGQITNQNTSEDDGQNSIRDTDEIVDSDDSEDTSIDTSEDIQEPTQEKVVKESYNIIINFLNNGKSIASSIKLSGEEGDIVDYSSNISSVEKSLSVRGYTRLTSALISGTLGKDLVPTNGNNIVINLYYEKNNMTDDNNTDSENDKYEQQYFKITFNYIDGLTSEKIADSKVEYQPLISKPNIECNPKEIDGYEFHYSVKIAHSNGDIDMNIYYSKKSQAGEYSVTFNYIEEETNDTLLVESIPSKLDNGCKYDASSQDKLYIQGYKYIKTVGKVKGTIENSDEVINVYYKKIKEYTVTINYLDYNSHEQIYKSYVSSPINQGEKYNLSKYNALNISGYNYYKTLGDSLSGTIDGNKVINVYYLKLGESAVNTGDYTNIYMWIILLIIAVVVAIAVIVTRKKLNKK